MVPAPFDSILNGNLLNGNPYFEAGFGLTLVGTCLAAARGGAKAAAAATRRHFLVTLEVTSKDRAYPWVLAWLTRQGSMQRGSAMSAYFPASFGTTLAQHVSVHTVVAPAGGDAPTSASPSPTTPSDNSVVQFDFAPCPGRHFVGYAGRMIMVERARADQAMMDLTTGQPFETVKLTTFGRSRRVFEDLLQEASHDALERERNTTTIFKSWGAEWQRE